MANSKDDIEILDFVDNELMEISQEELDNMQNMFDELEAASEAEAEESGDGSEAESLVVAPKSVDTRFAEPVDEADLAGLNLEDLDLPDLEADAADASSDVPAVEEAVDTVSEVSETADEASEPEVIEEISLDTSDVMADVNNVDEMLKDALGDLDLDDFDVGELSTDLDESLLQNPAEGAEGEAALAAGSAEAVEDTALDAETEAALADAVGEVEELLKEEATVKEENQNSIDFDEEGEPILDLEGVPVDEEDISEISTILSKPDNNDLVDDNLMDMFENI